MRKINDVKNWSFDIDGNVYFDQNGCVDVNDIISAALADEVKTDGASDDLRTLLGVCWDCAMIVRERLMFPANPHYAAVVKVSQQLKDHLGSEGFEKFLRPSNRVGLPPANG